MKGVIVNYIGGRHTQNNNYMIITVDDVDNREKANKLKDKEVIWKSPKGKILKGKVINKHGNKGALRVKFNVGLPGQSVGTNVEIENGVKKS